MQHVVIAYEGKVKVHILQHVEVHRGIHDFAPIDKTIPFKDNFLPSKLHPSRAHNDN